MRRLAGGIAGTFALIVMLLMQPWGRLDCRPPECGMDVDYGGLGAYALALAVYLAFPLLVVGFMQVAVLGMRDSSRPQELAVRAALGETQGTAVRAAAARGLRDGVVWVGAAYVIAAVTHVVILLATGWPLTVEGALWFSRAVVGALAIGVLVLAHVIDAARPRRTPVERLYEDARPLEVRRGARIVGVFLAVIAAVSAGVVVGLSVAYGLAPSFYVTNAAGIAIMVTVVAVLALALFVIIPASRRALPWWLGRVSRMVPGPAGAIVAARASGTSVAGGRLVLFLGSFAFFVGAATSVDPSLTLSPTYVGYRAFTGTIDADAFANQLREIDGVAGVVVAAAREGMDPNGNPGLMFALDTVQLRGLDDGLARTLAAHPHAIVENLWGGSADLHTAQGSDAAWGFVPSGVVPLAQCCEMFTSTAAGLVATEGVTAFLIYSTDPAYNAEVASAAWAISPGGPVTNYETSGIHGGVSTEWASSFASLAILAVLIGAPLAALAVGVVLTRRRDDATLAALGSTPRSLRSALVAETVAVALFAMIVGGGLGAGARALFAALQRSRASLTGVITDSYLSVALGSVAWVTLGLMIVCAAALIAVTAWIAAALRRERTPVQELTPTYVGGRS